MPTTQEDSRQENRTWLSAVVFLDVVGYTKGSVEQQIKIKDHMNSIVEGSVEGVDESDRVIVDSGDGAAVCFLGDPEDSLFCAVKLRDGFEDLSGQAEVKYEVRIGINLGPVKVVKDVNHRPNVLGDGINVAQRIMAFAGSGQIFVSRSFYECISCLSQEYDNLFHYQGKKNDKHSREHAVYEFNVPENAASAIEPDSVRFTYRESTTGQPETGPPPSEKIDETSRIPAAVQTKSYEWDPVILEDAEHELTQHIGPLAKILVKKIARTTNDVQKLYEQLADTLTDPDHRSQFLRQMPTRLEMANHEAPKTIMPDSAGANPDSGRLWNEEDLKKIEQHLVEHLGPLTEILVKKAAAKAGNIKELYELLADQLEDDEVRKAFLKTRH